MPNSIFTSVMLFFELDTPLTTHFTIWDLEVTLFELVLLRYQIPQARLKGNRFRWIWLVMSKP